LNKKESFLGIGINVVNKNEIIDILLEYARGNKLRTAFYLNAHCVNTAFLDPEYLTILNKSDLVYAGGIGVVWAARFLGIPLPERVNILDFFDDLLKQLVNKGITVYLLGGKTEIAKNTEGILKERGVKVLGSGGGFFSVIENEKIVKEINALKPNILMVGMGLPKQEKWIDMHRGELDVSLAWGVGAAFEWLSGQRNRAPKLMIEHGLEWLHRLYQQPRRLYKRYLVGNLTFIFRILKRRIAYGKNS